MDKKNWFWGILAVTAVGAAAAYLYTDFWEHATGKMVAKKSDTANFVTKYREVQHKKKQLLTEDNEGFQDEDANLAPLQNFTPTTEALADSQQKTPFITPASHALLERKDNFSKADTTSTTAENFPTKGSSQGSLPKVVHPKKQDTEPETVDTDAAL